MNQSESCLFFWHWWPVCMSRSEWASWVQAIGALVALYVAIKIARNAEHARATEVQHAVVRALAADAQRTDQAVAAARTFGYRLYLAVKAMRIGSEQQFDKSKMGRLAAVVAEVARMSDTLLMTDLPKPDFKRLAALRVVAAESVWTANYVVAHDVTWAHWVLQFEELENRVGEEVVALGGTLDAG